MNSNSEYFTSRESACGKQDRYYNCKDREANKVLFKSAYGSLGPLDVTFAEGLTGQAINQAIASVSIDTNSLRCADIIVDFTGILNVLPTVPATSTLVFTLYKTCRGFVARQPVATFNFYLSDMFGGFPVSHTLAFRYPAKNDCCDECCTYTLELSSISNIDLGTITYSINGILSVLAIESLR